LGHMSDSWSWSTATVQITGSNVSGPFNAVTVGGDATVEGETARDEDAFGAPGIVFRPRPPEKVLGKDRQVYTVGAEALAKRMGDRLTPFTWRDLRLNQVFPAPKPGTIAMVGYGGAFLSFDDAKDSNDRTNSLVTLYVPYGKNGSGIPEHCHAIVLDPTQEAIGIIHGSGCAISLGKDNDITMRADGSTSLVLKPGVFQVAAEAISLNGNVACGGVAAFPIINATAFATAITGAAGAFAGVPAVTGAMITTLLSALTAAIAPTGPASTQHLSGI
jgi:hypothetical protein